MRYLGTCDGNMQEGSLRADVNVSVRRAGDKKFGTRCEIKNVNSIKFMQMAIEYEANRQVELLEDGKEIDQETRLFDTKKNETRSMRSKEDAHDYRYFPDPDLLPLKLEQKLIDDLKKSLPELPDSIIVLDNGKIIQSGSHNELVKDEGYYKDLYLKQNSEINE